MRTLNSWRAVFQATASFASILLLLGFAAWVQPHGLRGNAAEPSSDAEDKEREPRALKPEEKRRDYPVIETCLIDLTDPKSPVNEIPARNGHVGKYIVLGPRTSRKVYYLSREVLPDLVDKDKGQTIPLEIGDDLRRRNPGTPASLEDFQTDKAPIRIRDVHADLEGAVGLEFAKKYWEKQPASWRYVYAYVPGYSKDGKRAVVIFEEGPSPHGAALTYLLVNSGGGWKIKWRNHYFW